MGPGSHAHDTLAAGADALSASLRDPRLQRLSVAELKQLVAKPEVVEWYDCSARDPRLLVSMKSYRKWVARRA